MFDLTNPINDLKDRIDDITVYKHNSEMVDLARQQLSLLVNPKSCNMVNSGSGHPISNGDHQIPWVFN
jgi:hypothetical protein